MQALLKNSDRIVLLAALDEDTIYAEAKTDVSAYRGTADNSSLQ